MSDRETWLHDLLALSERGSPAPWTVEIVQERLTIATAREDGQRIELRHDLAPAPAADVRFVVQSRTILPQLIEAVSSQSLKGDASLDLAHLEDSLPDVSAGPWIAHVEGEGIGGESMIWIGNECYHPDMYVVLGGRIAPVADVELIASLREAVPVLLSEIRQIRGTAGGSRRSTRRSPLDEFGSHRLPK